MNEPLAYRIYPLPNGTNYLESDLNNERAVEILFDYAQILEAVIYKNGWAYLIDKYGLETLFDLNRKSGWMDCETIEEYKILVKEMMSRESEWLKPF